LRSAVNVLLYRCDTDARASSLSGMEAMAASTETIRGKPRLMGPLSTCPTSTPDQATLVSIVDDDRWVGKSLERLLKSKDFRAQAFLSAEDYLQFGNHGETACLILDVRLPGISGLELQHNLAAKQNKVPFIMMSALDGAEIQVHALASGAVTLLGKPFDDNSLWKP
jgi:CheY-like chemotaxis protein